MLNTYHTESEDTPHTNAKRSLHKSLFTKMNKNMLQGTSLAVLRIVRSEGIKGNKDLRKENASCMPEELILCN